MNPWDPSQAPMMTFAPIANAVQAYQQQWLLQQQVIKWINFVKLCEVKSLQSEYFEKRILCEVNTLRSEYFAKRILCEANTLQSEYFVTRILCESNTL
jgi:hypothetical protein